MLKKFLKRFEKLEHSPRDSLYRQGLLVSKRFERLEIGERKIELVITDRVAPEEKAPEHIPYSIICPFCGKENLCAAKACASCQRSLQTRLVDNFQKSARSIKKCACGAMNQAERRDCWICGRDFSLAGDKNVAVDWQNEININIDGTTYKSSDKNLPLDVVSLMERIRKHGYSKELIDEWIKRRKEEEAMRRQGLEERIEETRSRLSRRQIETIISVAASIIFLVIMFLVKK